MSGDPRYGTATWKRLRRLVLTRDQHTCQIQGHGCTHHADTVDHIKPVAAGGVFHDPANLRAACKHCNSSEGGRLGQQRQHRTYPPPLDW